MKFHSTLSALFVATTTATYMCPVSPSAADAAAVSFGLSVQNLLSNYYAAIPINATFFSTLPSSTMTDFLANTMGLAVQAKLGVTALQQLATSASVQMPTCQYSYPPVTDAKSHLMNAYVLEATLCGAFIGLADYVQSPQAAFLMARLAAEHGIHASYIGSHMQPVIFPTNSTMLTPAFTPDMVSMTGMGVGYLGAYLNNCVMPPAAPCGGNVNIGSLGATLTGQGSMNVMNGTGTGAGGVAATGTKGMASPTTSVVAFTGGASSTFKGMSGVVAAAGLTVAYLM